jgi:hypothetical protein
MYSGWRDVGIDRNNYAVMYNAVISSELWTVKLWYAKDLFFLVIVSISNYFSDDAKVAFLVICVTSLLLKFFAIRRIAAEHALIILILYAIFLSPGLEFAAMRSGLAVGFLFLALALREKKYLFIVLLTFSATSHISFLPVIPLALRQINNFLSKNKWGYLILTLLVFMLSEALLYLFPHGVDYSNNHGTLSSFFQPMATLVIALLIFYRLDNISKLNVRNQSFQYLQVIRPLTYGLIAIAFGINSMVVTAATRYLEISWCLLLLASIVMFKKSYLNMLGGVLLMALLSYENISRMTWLAILNPNLG